MTEKQRKKKPQIRQKCGFEIDENSRCVGFNANIFINKYLMVRPTVLSQRGKYYQYSKNRHFWIEKEDRDIIKEMYKVFQKHAPNQWKSNFYGEFKSLLYIMSESAKSLKAPASIINLKNGLFNLETMGLMPHSQEYFTTYQLLFSYDKEAKCPEFKKFLNTIFCGDTERVKLIQEIFGYCLSPNTEAQKFFIWYSSGSSAKSALSDLLIMLAGGYKNVSAISLESLNQKFALSQIDGKLLNISPEQEVGRVKTRVLKQIVGGDPIQLEFKGRDPYTTIITAKLIFLTNNLPTFTEYSFGLRRRMIPIPFDVRFVKKPDPENPYEMKDIANFKETFKNELPGIFNYAMEGFQRLRNNDFEFTSSKRVEELLAEYDKDFNPIEGYIRERLKEGELKEERLLINDIYNDFLDWCERNRTSSPFMNINGFSRELAKQLSRFKLPCDKQISNGRTYFRGLMFKESDELLD